MHHQEVTPKREAESFKAKGLIAGVFSLSTSGCISVRVNSGPTDDSIAFELAYTYKLGTVRSGR